VVSMCIANEFGTICLQFVFLDHTLCKLAALCNQRRQLFRQGRFYEGIFIWVGQSKAKQILGRTTGVVYVGIMGMTRAVWVGQVRVWVGHGLPGLIARTASVFRITLT